MNKPSAGEESEEEIRKTAMDRPFKRRNDELLAKMDEDTESAAKGQPDFLIHDKEQREKDRQFQKEETERERQYKKEEQERTLQFMFQSQAQLLEKVFDNKSGFKVGVNNSE
ncbi:hypothetical protein RvY_17384 [Ramazzottius varieornatus]|uniref:Uncharacterized protein n=1 Tax=Ramazzottius varieornatus TaxID=947166 RepID=A0A1D1W2D9_RAMVA|nr:hypothetical protein RvY_17384 [Ramazzottius varieornatus]